jgi:hypothetical protein
VNEDGLRLLIRAAIQRHMSASAPETPAAPGRDAAGPPVSLSFAQYQLRRADGDTMCLIEPAVQCNHCGFCKCHGH